MANETRDARLIVKRTSVPGKIPTGTTNYETSLIRAGELAINLADQKLYSFDSTNVFEIGAKSYLGLTGGTISGNTYVIGDFSAKDISSSGNTQLNNLTLSSGSTVYGISNSSSLSENSDTFLATQKSIKTYIQDVFTSGSTTPGGINGSIQYKNDIDFEGNESFIWNNNLYITGSTFVTQDVVANNISLSGHNHNTLYYLKSETYNTGQTYTKTEINDNFLNLSGGTINGSLTITSGLITNLTGTTFNSTNANITNLTSLSGLITNLTGTTFNSTNANISNLTSISGLVTNLTGTTFNSTISNVVNLNATNSLISNLTATTSVYIQSDLNVSAIGSTLANPRIIGVVEMGVNTGARFQFGDTANAWQNGYNQAMQLWSYHTLIIEGDRNTTTVLPMETISNIGVLVRNNVATSPAFVIQGAASQSADLQEWRDSTGTVLSNINLSGNLYLGGPISATSKLHIASGSTDAGSSPIKLTPGTLMTSLEVGAIEFNNTVLHYTDNLTIPVRQKIQISSYGYISEDNFNTDTTISISANQWTGWVTASAGIHRLTQFTDNGTADRITILNGGDGVYNVVANIDVKVNSQNQDHYVALFKNGSPIIYHFLRQGSSNNWESMVIDGLVELNSGDYLDLRFSAPQNRTLAIRNTSIKITRIDR